MTSSSQLYIDGHRCDSDSGETYPVSNPADLDEHVGDAASGVASDVGKACQAAQAAFPAWAGLSYQQRAEYLNKAAAKLLDDEEDLERRISLFTREHGKLHRESTIENTRIADRLREVATYADRLATDATLPGPPQDTIVTRQPRGVAALVVPWNWPLAILGAKLPQALIAGNTVVIKLAKNSPLATAQAVALMADALPPGAINLVTGSSSRIGDALLRHSHIRYINFTGSVSIGKHVMSVAAENLTPVTLELGGNDAGIVLDDAKLDEMALQRLYTGAFLTSGQVCMALKRLYVHRSRFDEVVQGLSDILAQLVLGSGLDPEVSFAPVNNERQFKAINSMIRQAEEAGADVRQFGRLKSTTPGHFIKPRLVIDPDPALDVVAREQFGPILPVIPFDSDEQAIAATNNSEFGLCSSVWTQDLDRAVSLARRIEAGFTYINGHGPTVQDARAPFGGFKNSGIGRNFGYEGIVAFQGYHAISAPPGSIF